jgi:YaiO family outer membrane protein
MHSLFRLFITGLLVLVTADLAAQDNQAMGSDELFAKARELGFNGKRTEARNLCYTALQKSPGYSDIRIFLGRLYAWDRQYDSARYCFRETLDRDPKNIEAYSAWCDAELWSDHPSDAIRVADRGLAINSLNEELLLKKAKGLADSGQQKEAYAVVKHILKLNPKNTQALEYAERLKRDLQTNKISLNYDHDRFDKTFDPWNSLSLSYARQTRYLGSVIGRVNYANRFQSPGLQYEVDMYPSLGKKMYAYVSGGISNDAIFPKFRFGASVYRSLPNSFEAELGIRYLEFSTSTIIYTGSVGKYWKSFWFSLRPSYIPGSAGSSQSLSLITRYYLASADNYFTLTLASGLSPDELRIQQNNLGTNSILLNSQRVRIAFQHTLGKSLIGSVGTGIAYEEVSRSNYRTNYNFSIGIEKSF